MVCRYRASESSGSTYKEEHAELGKAITAACMLVGAVVFLAACGHSSSIAVAAARQALAVAARAVATLVDVYSSLPMQGALTLDRPAGERDQARALAGGRQGLGNFDVNYTVLERLDGIGKCDPSQTAANAKVAETRRRSCTSASPTPARARCRFRPQPAESRGWFPGEHVRRSDRRAGSAPSEPQSTTPTGKRTYVRIVPRDTIQAAAGLITMKKDGCTKIAVANDKEAYGAGLAQLLELQKGKYGMTITSNTGVDPTAPNFRTYASTIKSQGADCFYFAASSPTAPSRSPRTSRQRFRR